MPPPDNAVTFKKERLLYVFFMVDDFYTFTKPSRFRKRIVHYFFAAVLMAAFIRAYVPQRQILPLI